MHYFIPKKTQQTNYEKAMTKFKLISQIIKRIREKNITINEFHSWMDDNSFTENEKMELNWITYTI